jgi:diguanylate cyclase (GGDEF)-like protein
VLLARIRAARRVLELQDQVARDHQQMQEQLAELGVLTRRLQKASLTDPLTQLGNRRQAMERLAAAWTSASESGEALSLIMADLDHFKCVNDEHGHDVGDLVLKESANVLRAHTREAEELCRIGGEEFLLICPGAGLDGGIACAERLRSSLERHSIHAPGFSQRITASFGVALRTPDMRNADALLKAADLAVYEAKRLGRNRVAMYGPAAPVA